MTGVVVIQNPFSYRDAGTMTRIDFDRNQVWHEEPGHPPSLSDYDAAHWVIVCQRHRIDLIDPDLVMDVGL